jgi:hypothetical protein
MRTARVSSFLFLLLAIFAAASLPTGSVWATPGSCESLPGGVIELESTGGAVGPTGYATLGAALADVNNGSYTGTITIDVCGDTAEGASAVLGASGAGRRVVHGRHDRSRGRRGQDDLGRHRGGSAGPERGGQCRHRRSERRRERADDREHEHRRVCRDHPLHRGRLERHGPELHDQGRLDRRGLGHDRLRDRHDDGEHQRHDRQHDQSSGASLPTNAIYSAGTSTSVANAGIAITNNSIQDYFSATLASNGILVASNSASWTITGNKLFQTATRTATAANTHRAINVITASGGGYTVSNNTVGYSSAAGAGTTTYAGAVASLFRAIEMTVAVSPASDIQGNTVTAISFSTTSNSAAAPGVFAGTRLGQQRRDDVRKQTGSATTTGAITPHLRSCSLTEAIYVAAPAATVNARTTTSADHRERAPHHRLRRPRHQRRGRQRDAHGNTVGSTTAANSIRSDQPDHDRGDDLVGI